MTVQEIKQHLLCLLPNIIVQIDTNIDLKALYEDKTSTMIINEFGMFGDFLKVTKKKFLG